MSYSYIETTNGIPSGRIWSREQMQTKFPQHNFDSGPPPNYALFEPPELPQLGRYQRYDIKRMFKKPGTEIFTQEVGVRDADEYEKAADIEEMKRNFYRSTGYLSWTFDPAIDRWVPPKQPPNGDQVPDGAKFTWNEAQQEWVPEEN